ncbi:MAG: response regulator [Candidatus Cloacimonetes bacterium]|nr:response regulator [Candidatus Cloacimonadota bacterium]
MNTFLIPDASNLTEKRIIITDDDEDFLDILESQLIEADNSFVVLKAKTGYEALNLIQNMQIDLLITDIAMPDMDGLELYKRVSELRPNLPVIMMTGFCYDPKHTIINAKNFGLKDVIFKPFEIEKLLNIIYKRLKI